jgi:hypothetical protein
MARVIFNLRDDSFINIEADAIDKRDGFVMAWNGEFVVALVNEQEVKSCYISERKEG